MKTGKDIVLLTGKGFNSIRISNNDRFIAFIRIQQSGKDYFKNLLVYDRQKDSCISFYYGPSRPASSENKYIQWSANDKYLGIFYLREAIILDCQNISNQLNIKGFNFCWAGNDKIIFDRGDDTYIEDIKTKSISLLIKGVTKAVFLHSPVN
jgi:hypothetical protein